MTIKERIEQIQERVKESRMPWKVEERYDIYAVNDIEFLLSVIGLLMEKREEHWQTVENLKVALTAMIVEGERTIKDCGEIIEFSNHLQQSALFNK